MNQVKFSVSSHQSKRIPKLYTYGFKIATAVSLDYIAANANRFSISGPKYKDGHRKGENVTTGSSIILIDCDQPSQAEAVEAKIRHYDYVKVPSASNSAEKPYKWHFIIPTQEALSIYPAAFKWQVEQFFRQVGITDDMIDTTGSYDIARQFAPSTIKMTTEEADDLTEINDPDLQVPIAPAPDELCSLAATSISLNIKGVKVSALPPEHLWFRGNAITYSDAIKAVREATEARENLDDRVIVSGFGCPHDNQNHTGDVTKGYGFAFVGKQDVIVIKCSGNCCKDNPYFMIPEPILEIKANKYIDAKLEPIHPNDFREKVKERIHQLEPNFKFGENMMKGFFYYGATFNKCIYRNTNELPPMRLTVPAATGAGKSVSAKLYLSKIAMMGYSGLLIVEKVTNSIEATQEINEIAGKIVASCTYSISQKHPDCKERVDAEKLQEYPIIILTHNMFLSRSSSLKNLELYKSYQGKQRACIIIDEKINFNRTVSVTTDEIKEAIGLVHEIKGWDAIDEKLTRIFDNEVHSSLDISGDPDMTGILRKGIEKLRRGEGYVGTKRDKKYEDREAQNRDWMIRLLDRVAYVFDNNNIITTQGKFRVISTNEDLTNQFGTAVVMDATANTSLIYRSHMNNRDDILMFEMPEGIRNYQNGTLHICKDKNRRQSKQQLVNVPTANKTTNLIIDNYLANLYPLVADGGKLLVCTFMDIEEQFRSRCKDDNIAFIHWGEHAGRNDFSKYDKVAAIGWFRKSKTKYSQDIDAVQSEIVDYLPFTNSIHKDIEAMITGGLAADFVQLFNRSRSRVAIDENGNCAETHFYMFDDLSYGSPIPLIKKEMPGIKEELWEPVETYPIIKPTKEEERAQRIIKYLQTKPGCTVDYKTIIKFFDGQKTSISQKKFKEVTNSKLFKALLEDASIIMRRKMGRYGSIFFDVSEEYIQPLECDIANEKAMRKLFNI